MLPIQIIGLIFLALLLVWVWGVTYRKRISTGEALIWSALVILLMVMVGVPQVSVDIADLFGVSRGVDIVIYALLFFLIATNFLLMVRIETLDQEITKLTRRIALRKIKKK